MQGAGTPSGTWQGAATPRTAIDEAVGHGGDVVVRVHLDAHGVPALAVQLDVDEPGHACVQGTAAAQHATTHRHQSCGDPMPPLPVRPAAHTRTSRASTRVAHARVTWRVVHAGITTSKRGTAVGHPESQASAKGPDCHALHSH